MAITKFQVNAFPNGVDVTKNRVIIYGQITLAAATTVPVALDWTTLTNGNFGGGKFVIPNVGPTQLASGPQIMEAVTTAATPAETYVYSGGKLAQATNGTFVTSAVADTINFKAEFIKEKF